MSQLSPFIRAALLGTQREPIPDLPAASPLSDLKDSLRDADPETILLSLAGAAHLAELAGQLPDRVIPSSPIPADLPTCPSPVADRLTAMLDGQFSSLLPELLTALVQSDQRAPDHLLPALLDLGAKTGALRPLILQAIGQTGRWLAAQNPAWAYASPQAESRVALTTLWRDSTPDQRSALLAQLRALHPDWGRDIMQTTWKNETALLRSRFIRLMETGLIAADEPFLETALDDRDLNTRRAAVELLARLPESRLRQRMLTYVSQLVWWTPNQQRTITMILPAEITPSMLRDGIPAGVTNILRRSQIAAIVGAVPLDYWQSAWKAKPEKIIDATLASAWPRALMRGFAMAALRQRNTQWALSLLTRDKYSVESMRLIPILPLSHIEKLILNAPTPLDLVDQTLIVRLLYQWNDAWSTKMAQRWVEAVQRHLKYSDQSKPPGTVTKAVLKKFGQLVPINLYESAAKLLPHLEPESNWRSPVQEALSMLRFRQAMYADIHLSDSK